MKGVVVTTKGEISVRDFQGPLYRSVGEAVGGYIETVYPSGLREPYVMIVNEEGLLQGLEQNAVGSELYGTHIHGQPIVGNIVFLKIGYDDYGEPDIVGLNPTEAGEIQKICKEIITQNRSRDYLFEKHLQAAEEEILIVFYYGDKGECGFTEYTVAEILKAGGIEGLQKQYETKGLHIAAIK